MFQTEEMETSQGKGTTLGEKNPTKQPSPVRIETVREIVVPLKKKKSQIKKLGKEQKKLQNLMKQLKQKITALKRWKISRRTLKIVNAAIQTELHDTRAMKTQTKPILIQNNKEQHAMQTSHIPFHDKGTQTMGNSVL